MQSKWLKGFLVFLLFAVVHSKSQIQTFRYFGTDNGLKDNFITRTAQDKSGKLWISGFNSVYYFDGQLFKDVHELVKARDTSKYHIFSFTKNQIITASKKGDIFIYRQENYTLLKQLSLNNFPAQKFFLSADSAFLYVLSNGKGITAINLKSYQTSLFSKGINELSINDIQPLNSSKLLLASTDGLYLYDLTLNTLKALDNNIEANCVYYDVSRKLAYVGTKSFGLNAYLLDTQFEVDHVTNLYNSKVFNESTVTTIHADKKRGRLYFATNNGQLYLLDQQNTTSKSLIKRPLKTRIDNVFTDTEGNFWLSTFGKGLLRSGIEPFEKFFQGRSINAISGNHQDEIYFSDENSVLIYNKETNLLDSFTQTLHNIPNDKITALHCDKDQTIWLGFQNQGVYKKEITAARFSPLNENMTLAGNTINAITSSKEGEVFISTTLDGVYVLTRGIINSVLNTKNNLSHNNILYTYCDSKDRIWFATYHSTLSYMEEGKIYDFSKRYPNVNFDINAICEDKNGVLWFLTRDNGIYAYRDSLQYTINTENGLPSNFGTAILCDNDNQLWVAQTDLLTRFSVVRPVMKTFSVSRLLDNLYFNKNASYKDYTGNLWFGTTEGVIKYNINIEHANLPEATPELIAFKVFDEVKSLNQEQRLKYGTYNVSFQYSALSLTQSEDVLFKYMLVGFDQHWSEPTKRLSINYENLKDGIYTFKLMACNSNGLWNKLPLTFSFVIEKPVWKSIWFWALVALLFVLSVTLINHYRTRLLVKYNKQLASKIKEKTKQLEEEKRIIIKKNEEIEGYNKELNSSISYARHIQRSVLPLKTEMNTEWLSTFTIYRPRDVVSGDFYKVFHVGHKTVLLMADSTGHGVPGALLSMMGNSLLDTIVEKSSSLDPAEILHELDRAIIQTLQQTPEGFLNESMDIALLVFDTQKHEVLFAGARRPLYIVRKGELLEFSGNKFPVGGLLSKTEKLFETQVISLQHKDCLYIFSDGITDQFDRDNKFKFATKRLKALVTAQAEFSLPSQEFEINAAINNWKGATEQTDDILLIGIQYFKQG